ncbi:MAG TPA: hypothetical protein EYH34_00425 [Planctomycetes bacterium]|nr:hypothetical protein [Planctomycetota bacterium]
MWWLRRLVGLGCVLAAVGWLSQGATEAGEDSAQPLRMVVMDPLSNQLACACVPGYAQRDYQRLAQHLERELGRSVEVFYSESLMTCRPAKAGEVDLVVGAFSVVRYDAAEVGLAVRSVAMLTDQQGAVTHTGLFVVRREDTARSIEDLAGRRLLFGPEEWLEKHQAALAALEAFGLPVPSPLETRPACDAAALAVIEEEADAAVISSHALPLLKGCGTIGPDELKVVGRTDPAPFIGVFASGRVDGQLEEAIAEALSRVSRDSSLLKVMESRSGFVPLPPLDRFPPWDDWRGPGRTATTDAVPATLARPPTLLWARTMTGPAMAGVAVAEGVVVVADKSLDETYDIFRCLDADTGRQRWKLAYPAPGEMDFTNAPRAAPLVHRGRVYLLGAFGHLHCMDLKSGKVIWRRNLARDFATKPPMWGYCSTPLVVDQKLIVNPGAPDASLAALDLNTGRTIWKTPGPEAAYAGFILAAPSGVRQIIGYDSVSLGGWDPQTGERLWRLVPPWEGDFNVPTPVTVGQRLLVSTENNGTRLYRFDAAGRIVAEPVAANEELIPDTSTPVVLDGLVYGSSGRLVCLDLNDSLKTLWDSDQKDFTEYCTLVAGRGRLLVVTQAGKLCLLKGSRSGLERIGTASLFDDVAETDREVWSHPALVGTRLYIRNLLGLSCFLLN